MRVISIMLCMFALASCATAPSGGRQGDWHDSSATAEEMCAVAQCVRDVRITLKQARGGVFDRTFDALPAVQEGMVSVYPGVPVYFEADLEGDQLVNLKLVEHVVHPEKTVSATLSQHDNGSMALVTRNPFSRPLRIRMGMMPLERDDLVRTSSCPVVAGGSAYELWPFPIFQIVLGDMHLLEDDADMVCSE